MSLPKNLVKEPRALCSDMESGEESKTRWTITSQPWTVFDSLVSPEFHQRQGSKYRLEGGAGNLSNQTAEDNEGEKL